ncbi:MAG TPA: hypothetical protein VG713_11120, partial [Pirellulales bacterium]|nr:hypothetical protein [Pirellulales bacterium]
TDAIALIDSVNIAAANISNGQIGDSSFEAVNVGSGGAMYNPIASAWTFSGTAGVAGNGSGFTAGNPNAPVGGQVGFLQLGGSIAQVVRVANSGNYAVSFFAAQRGNYNLGAQTIQVWIDGILIATITPSSTSYTLVSTVRFFVGAGNHVVSLKGLATNDSTALIDAISLA